MEFEASSDYLLEMMDYIFKDLHGLDMEQKNKIQLACEEALVNIISYAYPEGNGKIIIERQNREKHLDVILRDRGMPFNPMEVQCDIQVHAPIEERKIGRLGIFLMRQMADDINYQRKNNENVLHLKFRI